MNKPTVTVTFVEVLRDKFEDELKQKTGWGRVEVLTAFDKACIKALVTYANMKGISLD